MPFSGSAGRLFGLAFPASLLALSTLVGAGCTAPTDSEADDEKDLGIFGQPIKGGYNDAADTSVVGIYDISVGAICSGSLLAPNMVLTARHCVSNTSESVICGQAKPGALHKASYFYVTTHPDLNSQNPADYHVASEVIGVPLDPNSPDPLLNKEDLCGRDMAILILKDNIDPAEAKPLIPRVDSTIVKGDQYYAVGFGATNDSGSGAGVRRRRDSLFVDCVSGECPKAYVKTTELVGDQGICQGDSGGPALDMQNRVFGVTSRGSLGCEDPVYGHIFGWGQWIKDTALHAAQVGGYAAPGWATGLSTDPLYGGAVGGACTDPACTSGICVNDTYCTHKCDAINVCPDGYECDAKYEVCLEKPKPQPEPSDTSGSGSGDNADESSSEGAGCGVGSPDPTKPIPWKSGAILLGALGAFVARRRRR